MLDSVFINHVWIATGVWALLYCSDYALTLACARMYRAGVDKHLVFKHLELTPYYQKDIAELRVFSPRFVLMLGLTSGIIWLTGSLQGWLGGSWPLPPNWAQNFYRFLLGGLLLMEAAVHVRHVRNVGLFLYARDSRGIQGRLVYSPWLSYRSSAIELFGFAAVFLMSFLVTSSWFFAGGAFKCIVEGAKHWRLSGREQVAPEVSEATTTSGHATQEATQHKASDV